MAFTTGMTTELSRLTACIIGVSGTGSIIAEQVCRLGFGRVILIDHDKVEPKNLNRILNSTFEDAQHSARKVDVMRRAIQAMGLGTEVTTFDDDLMHPDANVNVRHKIVCSNFV